MNSSKEGVMDDSSTPHAPLQRVEAPTPRRTDYEPPQLAVIGQLDKITLGSGGSMNDGINKLKKN
jgi:hypothetical protein